MMQLIPSLQHLGNIPSDWEHTEKRISPAAGLSVPGAHLKWYDIHPAGQATAGSVRDEARAFLHAEAEAGRLALQEELGFVLLHLDGGSFFLLVCVWRNRNEMWQALYFKDEQGFHPYPQREGMLRPAQNVFELDATSHERRAWSRYLRSSRDEDAKRAYLEDRCTGTLV